jgi:hypothetical protein
MDIFDARDELVGKEEDRLQGKLAVAEVEEIFQARAQEVKHHGVVVTLGAKPTNKRNANATGEGLVDTSLILQLRVLGLDRLKFDGNLLSRDDVRSKVNVAEGAGTDFSTDPVFVTDTKILATDRS